MDTDAARRHDRREQSKPSSSFGIRGSKRSACRAQKATAPASIGFEDQAARIRAARHLADSTGVPAFINARTDVFLKTREPRALI